MILDRDPCQLRIFDRIRIIIVAVAHHINITRRHIKPCCLFVKHIPDTAMQSHIHNRHGKCLLQHLTIHAKRQIGIADQNDLRTFH